MHAAIMQVAIIGVSLYPCISFAYHDLFFENITDNGVEPIVFNLRSIVRTSWYFFTVQIMDSFHFCNEIKQQHHVPIVPIIST